MLGVLAAERAVLVHLKSVGIVLLVLHRIVVSLLALAARKGDSFSHNILRICCTAGVRILPLSKDPSIKKDPERFNHYNKGDFSCQVEKRKKVLFSIC